MLARDRDPRRWGLRVPRGRPDRRRGGAIGVEIVGFVLERRAEVLE
jgi:hypothetical protein